MDEEVKSPERHTELPPALTTIRNAGSMREAIAMMGRERFYETLRLMYEAYPKGHGMTMLMIADELKKPYSVVKYWLKKLEAEKILVVRPPIRLPSESVLVPYIWMDGERSEMVDNGYVYRVYVYPGSDMCYIIGFCIGDGNVEFLKGKRRPYRITLCNTDWSLLDPVLSRAERVARRFGVKAAVSYHDREGKKVPRENAYAWHIRMASSSLARIIGSEEGIKQKSLDVLLSPKFMGDFLAGLWDADGYVLYRIRYDKYRRQDVRISLRQSETRLPLLHKIYLAFKKVKISASAPNLVIPKTNVVRIIAGKPAKFKEAVHEIRVYADGVPSWVQFIGKKMVHPRKVSVIKTICKMLKDRGQLT